MSRSWHGRQGLAEWLENCQVVGGDSEARGDLRFEHTHTTTQKTQVRARSGQLCTLS